MNELTFDVETVPQQSDLSEIQVEELEKRMNSYLSRNPDADEDEAKNLIMSTNPYFGELVCIGLKSSCRTQSKTKALIGSEKDILTEFWTILKEFRGIFVSFGGLNFDVPFILKRSMKHLISPTNKNFLDTRRFQKFPHFDVGAIISDYNHYARATLRLVCEQLGIPSPKEEGICGKDVAAAFLRGEIDKIAKYCLRDVDATHACYLIAKNYTFIKAY